MILCSNPQSQPGIRTSTNLEILAKRNSLWTLDSAATEPPDLQSNPKAVQSPSLMTTEAGSRELLGISGNFLSHSRDIIMTMILSRRRRHRQHDEEMAALEPRDVNTNHDHFIENEIPWTPQAAAAATTLCMGTAISTLFAQQVSTTIPQYFYAVAVVSPLLGFVCYTMIGFMIVTESSTTSMGGEGGFTIAFKCAVGIGFCFALHNILVDYGRSGTKDGEPDVSAVLSLILLKLVVPVSFGLESVVEQQCPTRYQLSGIAVFVVGVLVAGWEQTTSSRQTSESTHSNGLKVLSLVFSSIPLAVGFYVVKLARRWIPSLSGIRLWQLLCIPEFALSILLAFASQHGTSWHTKSINIYDGVICVLFGAGPNECQRASLYLWSGLPFSLALNLSIPALIKLKGSSTTVPLFRAMALPIAALLAMFGLIVVSTPFSWDAVLGVLLCSVGLLLFYRNELFCIEPRT